MPCSKSFHAAGQKAGVSHAHMKIEASILVYPRCRAPVQSEQYHPVGCSSNTASLQGPEM